jgi:oligopeptide transport system substrate-binding protein
VFPNEPEGRCPNGGIEKGFLYHFLIGGLPDEQEGYQMKKRIAIFLVVLLAVALAACSGPAAKTSKPAAAAATGYTGPKVLHMSTTGMIPSFDPQISNSAGDIIIFTATFEGLVTKKNGQVIPGVAEKWEITKNNTVYTFHLRDTKWSDGKAVTAQDFFDSFVRLATDPRCAEQLWYADPIVNIRAISNKEADVSTLGVKVIDDKTFQITLSAPTPYFLQLLTHSMFMPIRSDLVAAQGVNYGQDAKTLAYNGAFTVKEWVQENKLVLVKNPGYWRADEIKLDSVVYQAVPDANAAKNMFDIGEIDFLTLGAAIAPLYVNNPSYREYDGGGSEWIQFSVIGKKPETGKVLANRNFILALSYAMDRTALDTALFKSNYPYGGVINPGITAYGDVKWGKFAPEAATYHPLKADVAKAKKYLDKALKELGLTSVGQLPTFTYTVIDGEFYKTVGEYFQDVFTRELGLKWEVEQLLIPQFYKLMQSGAYDLMMPGWGPDWDDPDTYMSMWHSNHPNNVTGIKLVKLDQMLDAIKVEPNEKKRAELYKKAEKLLVTEGAVIPLHMRKGAYVYNDRVQGIIMNMIAPSIDYRWADIVK